MDRPPWIRLLLGLFASQYRPPLPSRHRWLSSASPLHGSPLPLPTSKNPDFGPWTKNRWYKTPLRHGMSGIVASFFRRPLPLGVFHPWASNACFRIFLSDPHTYEHIKPLSTPNVHRNPLVWGACNAAIGSVVSTGNGNSHCFNAFSFKINLLTFAKPFAILSRSCFTNPCGRWGVKWASIWLGNTAYLHFLQIITRNSGKWINWSIIA